MFKQGVGWLLASALTGGALLAGADESANIVGTLDGDERAWFVLRQSDDSNATFMDVGDQRQVEVTGFVDPLEWDAQEALVLSFVLEGDELVAAKVMQLIGHTAMPPLYTSEGGSVDVTLNHGEQQGRELHLKGEIQGVLALQRDANTPPNTSEGIDIHVHFELVAQRVEF